MSSYVGKHAELYDLFYREKQYQAEADLINLWLGEYTEGGKKVLELACGTGNHAMLLSGLGYDVVATDYSEDMINQAVKKNSGKANPVFKVADMFYLDESQQYDAVICLFDSIGYVQTNEAVNRVLKNVHNALKPGGIFIFEFWHGAAMIRSFDPLRVKYFKKEKNTVQRISETSIDYASQVCSVKYTIHEFDETDNKFSTLVETQKNRFFMLQEMRLFLENNNFEILRIFNGFTNNETIDDNSWHIVPVCRRK